MSSPAIKTYWEDEQGWEIDSHGILGAAAVGKMILCHQLACPGVPLASKHIWEDDQVWESDSHAIPGATTVGKVISCACSGIKTHLGG